MEKLIERPGRQKKAKEGDVLAIPLGGGMYGFGQVCPFNCYAFFDLQSDKALPVERIVSSPILFRVNTSTDAVKSGGWVILGSADLNGVLLSRPIFWTQPVGANEVSIYKDGVFTPATIDEIKGLEVLASWYAQHITQRLNEHFSGCADGIARRTNRIRFYDPATGMEVKPD